LGTVVDELREAARCAGTVPGELVEGALLRRAAVCTSPRLPKMITELEWALNLSENPQNPAYNFSKCTDDIAAEAGRGRSHARSARTRDACRRR
jgi:hypothetical protein